MYGTSNLLDVLAEVHYVSDLQEHLNVIQYFHWICDQLRPIYKVQLGENNMVKD